MGSIKKLIWLLTIFTAATVIVAALYGFDEYAKDRGFSGLLEWIYAKQRGITDPVQYRDVIAADLKLAEERRRDANTRAERAGRSLNAAVEAQFAVRDRLKAPATAKFQDAYLFDVRVADDGATYFVSGYVDAQNSFGAMIRSTFLVKLRHLGGRRWSVDTVAIN